MEPIKADIETRGIKRIIVEVPVEFHSRFKMLAYGEGRTIRQVVIGLLETYIEMAEKNHAKGKS